MIALLGGAIALLILLGLPLGFAIIISCLFVILLGGSINPVIIPQRMFAGMDSFSLLAIPFFLLAGSLMTAGGISDRLISLANALVGRFRGGLAISNILTSILFGGISGSAVADTSAIGGTFIPAMTKEGYDAPFAVAATAASSPLSPLIPPSIAWIIYGYITDTSIIRLFAAGIVPGLIWGFSLILVTYGISCRRRYPVHEPAPISQVWHAFKRAFFALMMPGFILIGILSGVFTVTEASAIAVVYALCVGLFVYRMLDAPTILLSLKKTSRTVAAIMIIVGGAKLFAWVLAYTHTPEAVADWMMKMTDSPIAFLMMVNLLLLAVGTFMEVNAAKVMMLPVLFPIAMKLGIDPIHFGVVVTVNLCIGLVTPPIGMVLALGCRIGGISLEKGAIAIFPFFVIALIVLVLLTFFPVFSIWLPNLLLG